MSKRINIIGSGWLALPLAKKLDEAGNQVLLTSTNSNKVKTLQHQGFNAVEYLLGNNVDQQLLECDVLIIAITSKDVAAYQSLMSQINEQITKHLIFISSTSVYAYSGKAHDENSTSLDVENPLLQIEKLIQKHPKSTIIRLAGLVGPGRHPGRFFVGGRTIKNPTAPVNFIHLVDCIGIIKTIIIKNAWNEIYNGCADNHPTKKVFYQQAIKALRLPELEFEQQSTTSNNKVINNHKVKKQLGYQFNYPDVLTMPYF